MALYHVHAGVIRKGDNAAGFSQYLHREERESPDHASLNARYIHREGWSTEDLVAKGEGGMPAWAESSVHFWHLAERYERGKWRAQISAEESKTPRPGTVARTYEIALPRELSPEGRLDLAADMRSTFFEQFPHTWAIHNPLDAQGQEHPHMHIMFSERRATDTYLRSAAQYFARAAAPGQDPALHGVRKDRSWQGAARLHELRAGIATLTNAALERAGVQAAVSHRSLVAQGITRDPLVYTNGDKAAVEAQREALAAVKKFEAMEPVIRWQGQKVREGIRDLSREAMVDRIRDRFWLKDTSPGREQERQQSMERTIAREHQRTGRPLQGPRQERARPQEGSTRDLVATLARLTAQLRGQEHAQAGAALNVRLYERERDRGMGL